MQINKQALLMDSLASESYKKRLQRGRRFEQVEGAGMLKRIERLFVDPGIYIPYLLYAKAGISRKYPTTMTLFWGRKIQMPLNDYDALILYMYGGLYGSELTLTKFLIKNLGPDDVFYDVGANRGFYTFLGSDLCKETHTFEPVTELAEIIKANTRSGNTVVVNAIALSDTNGTIDFYIMDSTMTSTINPTVAELLSSHDHPVSKKITVPTMTIDEYVATHTKPTLLKIDAEGAEDQIIKGGTQFFSSNAPMVTLEIWGKDNKWELSMAAADRLRSMGYRSFRVDSEGDLKEITGDLSEVVALKGGENFVFRR